MPCSPVYTNRFMDEFEALEGKIQDTVWKKILQIIEKPEHFDFLHKEKGVRKARVGSWRILFRIEGEAVKFYKIGKRDSVYRQLDGLVV